MHIAYLLHPRAAYAACNAASTAREPDNSLDMRTSFDCFDEMSYTANVAQFVPGYEASFWFGVGAPKATPAKIVDKLNKEVNAALDDPKMKARLADLGGVALPGSPAEFGKLISAETEKWAKVIKFAGIKAE
jgi:hypothetical protein